MKYSYILQFTFLTLAASLSSLTLNAQDDCSDADILIYTEGLIFTPDAIEVPVGSVVGWVNTGGTHNANGDINTLTSMSFNNPEAFYFDLISGDEQGVCIGTHTFTIEGLYNYDCSGYGHAGAGMVATLTVVGVVEINLGCIDDGACNFNAGANQDDGSCQFTGDVCDDGDELTMNDVLSSDCICEGVIDGVDEQLTSETYISVYPNPVSKVLTIESAFTDQPVVIFDASGRIIAQYNNSGKVNIDVSAFEIGVYTVESAGNISRFIVE